MKQDIFKFSAVLLLPSIDKVLYNNSGIVAGLTINVKNIDNNMFSLQGSISLEENSNIAYWIAALGNCHDSIEIGRCAAHVVFGGKRIERVYPIKIGYFPKDSRNSEDKEKVLNVIMEFSYKD